MQQQRVDEVAGLDVRHALVASAALAAGDAAALKGRRKEQVGARRKL